MLVSAILIGLFVFLQLAQKHREKYKDKTDTHHPVSFFIIPMTENKKCLQKLV